MEPSTFTTQTFLRLEQPKMEHGPGVDRVKAIRAPSGDQAGAKPLVTRRVVPSSRFAIVIPESESKAILLPSGDQVGESSLPVCLVARRQLVPLATCS